MVTFQDSSKLLSTSLTLPNIVECLQFSKSDLICFYLLKNSAKTNITLILISQLKKGHPFLISQSQWVMKVWPKDKLVFPAFSMILFTQITRLLLEERGVFQPKEKVRELLPWLSIFLPPCHEWLILLLLFARALAHCLRPLDVQATFASRCVYINTGTRSPWIFHDTAEESFCQHLRVLIFVSRGLTIKLTLHGYQGCPEWY